MGATRRSVTGCHRRDDPEKAIRFSPGESILEIETPIPPPLPFWRLFYSGLRSGVLAHPGSLPSGCQDASPGLRTGWTLRRSGQHGLPPGLEPLPSIDEWWEMVVAAVGHVRLYPAQGPAPNARCIHDARAAGFAPPSTSFISWSIDSKGTALLDEGSVDDLLSDLTRQGYMPKEV